MPGNIRLYGTTGYVELAAPATGSNTTLTLPTDSIKPGIILTAIQSFSSTLSVSINDCFSSTYDTYKIIINTQGTTNSQQLYLRARANLSDFTTNYAGGAFLNDVTSASTSITKYNSSTYCGLGYIDSTFSNTISLDLTRNTTGYISITGTINGTNAGVQYQSGFIGCQASNITTGFTLASTATMTGTIRVLSYRNNI